MTSPHRPMAKNLSNPLRKLVDHWGLAKVAKRFGVTPRTVSRWQTSGIPQGRRSEVTASARRVDQALERAAVNDDWAREVLSRWVAAGNEESDAMMRLRELSVRKRRTRLDEMAIQTWQGLLAESREYRRTLGQQLNTRRFRTTPTGKQVGTIRERIDWYADAYRKAVENDNPREISMAWKSWERQVKKLAEQFEGLQIPGMTQRQVYTLFFSP